MQIHTSNYHGNRRASHRTSTGRNLLYADVSVEISDVVKTFNRVSVLAYVRGILFKIEAARDSRFTDHNQISWPDDLTSFNVFPVDRNILSVSFEGVQGTHLENVTHQRFLDVFFEFSADVIATYCANFDVAFDDAVSKLCPPSFHANVSNIVGSLNTNPKAVTFDAFDNFDDSLGWVLTRPK